MESIPGKPLMDQSDSSSHSSIDGEESNSEIVEDLLKNPEFTQLTEDIAQKTYNQNNKKKRISKANKIFGMEPKKTVG